MKWEIRDTYNPPASRRPAVRGPEDAAKLLTELPDQYREMLVCLFLDSQARLVQKHLIAVGSLNVARATPRDVLLPALVNNAAVIVMAHNHPSGIAEPSEDDIRFTRSVGRAANLMGVALVDHLILARDGLYSMRARGITWEGQDQ